MDGMPSNYITINSIRTQKLRQGWCHQMISSKHSKNKFWCIYNVKVSDKIPLVP